MKISRISSLALALFPLWASAQSSVTAYGRIDLSMDSQKTGPTSLVQMRDNASRLGFRGVEDLGGGLKAVFGLEMGLAADTGVGSTPMFRNSYVGLTGAFGAFAMGRLDSANPTKSPIYSTVLANVDVVIHDAGAPALSNLFDSRNRSNNSIGYASPNLGGATIMARYRQNGDNVAESAAGPIRFESDIKQYDLGVSYKLGGMGLGVGYAKDSRRAPLPANTFDDKKMLMASYNFNFMKIYGVYGMDSYENFTATSRDEVEFFYVGASFPIGAGKLIANYGEREVQTNKTASIEKISIGYEYNLSKRTKVYGLYDRQDPNNKVSNDVIRNVSLGIQHNF